MLSSSGQSAVVVSGVTTYQSSCGGRASPRAAVYQTGRLMEWWCTFKGVGRWGSGGKRGSRVTNWAQKSMTISWTWAWQSTDQRTLDITGSVCMSVVYDHQVTDMDGRGVCGVTETPGMWDTLHTAFDRSSGTLSIVGGGGWRRFVAWLHAYRVHL